MNGPGGTPTGPSGERARRTPTPTPPAPITRLSPAVASQLAAGEVVERPASVIKELVENSLDAGARNVTIDLEAGGIRAIRIADDGGGVRHEDLALALERHATSKIASLDDLFQVASLGFRGEALASIAAVSRLTLTSRVDGDDSGWRIRGGGGGAPEPARHPPGTTVEVRDLFHSVPARRRFLRTERTELQHVVDTVRRLALARPDVAFRVRHAERTVFRARHGAERVDEVVGRGFAASAAPVEAASDGMHLRGWIGVGSPARQFFFLNGRGVRDRALGHAVRIALEGRFPPGRDAVVVLFLALDPTSVDVNVHPGKHEVRFREPRAVHDFLVTAIRRALGGGFGALAVREADPPASGGPVRPAGAGVGAPAYAPGRSPEEPPGASPAGLFEAPPGPSPEGTAATSGTSNRAGLAAEPRASRPAHRPPAPGRAAGRGPVPERPSFAWIAGRHAVVELDGRVFVIDLGRGLELAVHAACARASDARPVPSVPLLVPARAKVAEPVLDRFEPEAVARFGLVVRRLGPDLASLLEVPRTLRHCEPSALARTVIEAGGGGGPDDLAAALGRAAGSAVPAARAERDALLGELLKRPGDLLVPAAARELGEREVARLFAR